MSRSRPSGCRTRGSATCQALGLGRDPALTPMPWDGSAGAGFTTGEPWLPLGADHGNVNVAGLAVDPAPLLSLYRALLTLRRAEPALSVGAYVPVRASETVLVYERCHADRRLLVALNMSAQPQDVPEASGMPLLLSTYLDRTGRDGPT